MRSVITLLVATFAFCITASQAASLWNESVNGPLGDVPESATPLGNLLSPTSEVSGSASHISTGGNYSLFGDYFRFTVPSGYQVDSVSVSVDKPNAWVWIGSSSFNDQIGFTANATSGPLLPQLGLTYIPSGNYGMYVEHHQQDSNTSSVSYVLSFTLSAAQPNPSKPAPGIYTGTLLHTVAVASANVSVTNTTKITGSIANDGTAFLFRPDGSRILAKFFPNGSAKAQINETDPVSLVPVSNRGKALTLAVSFLSEIDNEIAEFEQTDTYELTLIRKGK